VIKTLIFGLLLMAGIVLLIPIVQQDNGYVLLSWGGWSVEGSLFLFAALDLALFFALYFLIRMLFRFMGIPERLHAWKRKRGARRARRTLTMGLVGLSEGKWKEAEKSLTQHVKQSETPLLNYLAAAKAAQQLGAHERRDGYLKQAHLSMPSADVAVGLTQAELQLAHEQYEQALATLRHLQGIAPHHAYVLKLLKDLYLRLQDWTQLQGLLPELSKRKVLSKEELKELEVLIYSKLLGKAAEVEDPERVTMVWNGIPKHVRAERAMMTEYCGYLLEKGKSEISEPLLRDMLRHQWDDELVELYGNLQLENSAAALTTAESWLDKQPQNPVLLLALGRLSLQGSLWGKARSYLEASIGIKPTTEAYCELGRLLERMGESDEALNAYRSGMAVAVGSDSDTVPEPIEMPAAPGEPVPVPAVDHPVATDADPESY
jgi:HemY protein